jgi:hypothetical protein
VVIEDSADVLVIAPILRLVNAKKRIKHAQAGAMGKNKLSMWIMYCTGIR